MNLCADISAQIKSRQFARALALIRGKEESLDGRGIFKLLRSLATQLKQNPSYDEAEALSEFLNICCRILDESHPKDLLNDETEFTQGVLSLYYLGTLVKLSDMIIKLSGTLLSCLRKMKKSIKDVEAIAANFFTHLWNLSNKVDKSTEIQCRINSLALLIHGGSKFWAKVIEKLISATQEPSETSVNMATHVFLEFVTYHKVHESSDMIWMSSALQAWVLLVFLSTTSSDYDNCTEMLREISQKTDATAQINWLMELSTNILGRSSDTRTVLSLDTKALFPLPDGLRIVFLRIAFLTLQYASMLLKKPLLPTEDNKRTLFAIMDSLLLFGRELHNFQASVESLFQTDLHLAKLKYITRASAVMHHLLKLDESGVDRCPEIFRQLDDVISSQNDLKSILSSLSPLESYFYNVGVHFYQKSEYSRATLYFRKALEYNVTSVTADSSSENGLSNFKSKLSVLYETRFRAQDWNGVVDDFTLCLKYFFDKKESTAKSRLCTHPAFSSVMSTWSKLKRDLQSVSPLPTELLETTLVDLLKKNGIALKPNLAWDLLYEEFVSIDRRKCTPPHAALNRIAKQCASVAQTALQKGIAYYLLSRVGNDNVQRHAYANTAIAKLGTLPSQSDQQWNSQVYLGLSYLELYVSQQELMKKKTEEEMQSLGPLIQSRSTDVPPGEDGSNVASDGTSVDAISYSYLKLELELQNQEWMVKCLQQWEELVQFSWTLDHYSRMIFNCLKSLGYYFALYGNSFYSARAWLIVMKVADTAKCDEELVLAAGELLRLGLSIDSAIFDRCKGIVSTDSLTVSEQAHFHVCLAWFYYYQQQFSECFSILNEKILQAPALNKETMVRGLFLAEGEAYALKSLLAVMPEELSQLSMRERDAGPIQFAAKSYQSSYTALKSYRNSSEQVGWESYHQEWNALRLVLFTSLNAAKQNLYTAAHREARFFIKEALNTAQRQVCVLRTAEALLDLSVIDLMLDNMLDCQSKLLLICHMMGVAPPIVPDVGIADAKDPSSSPISPVAIKRNRTAARKVPEIEIQVQQDATHRAIKQPYMHGGASPNTKARELTDGIFPEHSLDCICLTCTSELVASTRCYILTVQAKLWSLLGFQELANDEFTKGYQMVLTLCAKLRPPAKSSLKHSKRLFDVPDGPRISEMWSSQKLQWLQPAVVTGLELMFEHSMHAAVAGQNCDETSKLKTILFEFYRGPLEHRMIKLVSGICVQESQVARVSLSPDMLNCDSQDDSIVILDGGSTPKTPCVQKKPIEMPAPRRNRRNIFGNKVEDTITIEDEDSDEAFSRRRLGKPTKAMVYSSDSDSDVVPGTPPLPPPKTAPKSRAVNKKKEEADSSTDDVLPVRKRVTRKISSDQESDDSIPKRTVRTSGRTVPKAITEDTATPKLTEKKFFKSKAPKKESDEAELSARLAKTTLDFESAPVKETRPKRATRSTKK